MTDLNLKLTLERLGLLQSEFARLLDVSPRTVNLWATGESAVPGPALAYLRLLERLTKDMLADELNRVERRPSGFVPGIYCLRYRMHQAADWNGGSGLVIFRDGKIFGSDHSGGVIDGSYACDISDETAHVCVRIEVPCHFQLIKGFAIRPNAGFVEINALFRRPDPDAIAVVSVSGQLLDVQLTYIGRLPN